MTSHDGSYSIVIVDPADDMNTNASNALLKNLEEPPARTLFILIAHSIRQAAADDPFALPDDSAPAAECGRPAHGARGLRAGPAGPDRRRGRSSSNEPPAVLVTPSCSPNMEASRFPPPLTGWSPAKLSTSRRRTGLPMPSRRATRPSSSAFSTATPLMSWRTPRAGPRKPAICEWRTGSRNALTARSSHRGSRDL